MNKLFLWALCALYFIAGQVEAQQIPLSSQYMLNPVLYNPAIAGFREDIYEFRVQNRNQWVGLKDAPVTQALTAHGLLSSVNVGLGLSVLNDAIGPFKQTGVHTLYSYHFPVSNESNLSFGLGLGLFQYKFNQEELTTDQPNDQAVNKAGESHLLPDAMFGALFYGEGYYAGISVPHLLGGKIKETDFRINRHFLVMGGKSFELGDDLLLEPSVMLRFVMAAPLSFDINSKLIFKETFWIGASYRKSDAIVAMAGIHLNRFHFGYSYDITTSPLNAYTKGSHEFMAGFDLVKKSALSIRRSSRSASYF